MIVYISGPMRGYPNLNFPAFDACRDYLMRNADLLNIPVDGIYSPADMDRAKGFDPEQGMPEEGDFSFEAAIRRDIEVIAKHCDAMVFLPGWEKSVGAKIEYEVGKAVGCQFFLFEKKMAGPNFVTYLTDVSSKTLDRKLLDAPLPKPPLGEYRETDPTTGGQKGQKDIQLSMVPVGFLEDLGRVYAMGAAKYDRNNWRKGYAWHLSIDAALRHLLAWLKGENIDPESGVSHLAHLAWHAATLHTFQREGLGTDDRYTETENDPAEQGRQNFFPIDSSGGSL